MINPIMTKQSLSGNGVLISFITYCEIDCLKLATIPSTAFADGRVHQLV